MTTAVELPGVRFAAVRSTAASLSLRTDVAMFAGRLRRGPVAEAVRINEEARLRALKAAFIILAAIALLAIFPARGLPNYTPGEVSAGVELETQPAAKGKAAAAV